MKIYKTQKEFEKEIKDGRFYSEESIDISMFDLDLDVDIEVKGNITARDISAWNISAWDISAESINAWDINAWDINAVNINAVNINAGNISAGNISAKKITYYAVMFAYKNINAESIQGRRENSKHFVLDGEIKIKN